MISTFPPGIPPADRPLTDAERAELTAIVVAAYGPDHIARTVARLAGLRLPAEVRPVRQALDVHSVLD